MKLYDLLATIFMILWIIWLFCIIVRMILRTFGKISQEILMSKDILRAKYEFIQQQKNQKSVTSIEPEMVRLLNLPTQRQIKTRGQYE